MPCLCASDAPKKSKSCCCHEEEPLGKTECCCTVKDKPEFTVETPSLPVDVELALPVEIFVSVPEFDVPDVIHAVDTGPPDHSVSVLRL